MYHINNTGCGDLEGVQVELCLLSAVYTEPFGEALIPIEENLLEDGLATIVVNDDTLLGMTIHNKTDLPLYPYLFYFDPSYLRIGR